MRRFLWLSVTALFIVSIAVASSGGATRAESRWVITDLGTLGGKESQANAVNERGQIVGASQTGDGQVHAFLWQNGKMRDLGTLGGTTSTALDINDRGQVVGWAYTTSGTPHGFLWENGEMHGVGTLAGYRHDAAGLINERGQVVGIGMNLYLQGVPADQRAFLSENGNLRDLGKLPDYGYTTVVGLNDRGQVAGTGFDTLDDQQQGRMLDGVAFVWANGTLRPLATPGESGRSEAVGINERGQVIGVLSRVFRRETRSALWEGSKVHDLGTLGGKWSRPSDVNGVGAVVGWAETGKTVGSSPSAVTHAFLWRDGKMSDLGTLGGALSSALAVNDRGQVVGWSSTTGMATDGGPIWHAFLWESGRLTDLGTLGGPRSVAVKITEHGQIVGASITTSGRQRAVLWTLKR